MAHKCEACLTEEQVTGLLPILNEEARWIVAAFVIGASAVTVYYHRFVTSLPILVGDSKLASLFMICTLVVEAFLCGVVIWLMRARLRRFPKYVRHNVIGYYVYVWHDGLGHWHYHSTRPIGSTIQFGQLAVFRVRLGGWHRSSAIIGMAARHWRTNRGWSWDDVNIRDVENLPLRCLPVEELVEFMNEYKDVESSIVALVSLKAQMNQLGQGLTALLDAEASATRSFGIQPETVSYASLKALLALQPHADRLQWLRGARAMRTNGGPPSGTNGKSAAREERDG